MWPLLAEAREALGTLNGIVQTLPNPQLLIRPLQNREAITSSSLEGTFVTPEQLLLFELEPVEPRRADEPASDSKEVHNYNLAIRKGRELLEELPFCLRIIKEMHRTLMQGVRGKSRSPGEFRRGQVQIGERARFVPPPAEKVPELMGNLEQYMNAEDDRLDPLVRCFVIHYQFETIHPFVDGNGRVGRALLALMIYKWLGHSMPFVYMSAFYERYKDEYMTNLFNVSTKGDWSSWIEFSLRGSIAQARDSIRRCKEFIRLRDEFKRRVLESGASTSRLIAMVEDLFSSPLVTIPKTADKYGVTYPTARSDIAQLVNLEILSEMPNTRPKAFYSRDLMRAAYEDGDFE